MSLFVHELTWRPKIVNVRNQIDESYRWCEEALTQAMSSQGSPSALEKQVDSIVWACMARLISMISSVIDNSPYQFLNLFISMIEDHMHDMLGVPKPASDSEVNVTVLSRIFNTYAKCKDIAFKLSNSDQTFPCYRERGIEEKRRCSAEYCAHVMISALPGLMEKLGLTTMPTPQILR
ncbi:MAG: hypothetical protein L7H00_01650 [Vulcanisaeta sp.]|nr:hypothetical protein [Vulcanisaeta sp.]MCG2892215.1 hypothetical protein [Vulcanisaeta sp.]MCG2894993.1 hypothetical protein [Vulcanisaeta sp.]